jgi:hypothetical protein
MKLIVSILKHTEYKNLMKRLIAGLLLIIGLSPMTIAHPGHGFEGPNHYLLSPEHSIVLAGVLGGIVYLLARISRKKI